jgi:hypothetical protein
MKPLPLHPKRHAVPGNARVRSLPGTQSQLVSTVHGAVESGIPSAKPGDFAAVRRASNALSLLDPTLPKSVPPYLDGIAALNSEVLELMEETLTVR